MTLSAAVIGAAAASASAATVNYVALGDSYSSGTGTGSYDLDSACQRSSKAYPAKWAAAHSPASFKFAACSGATTTDVLNKQLGSLSSSTSLVSITIGGNDAGFSSVMQTCVLGSDSSCTTAVNNAKNFVDTQLPGRLSTLYSTMRSKAPNSHFVVLDYPRLYITNDTYCVGMSHTKHVALNAAATELDTVIGKAAADAGFGFADVRGQFSGHELCSGDGWLHSVTIPIGDSYHPTATGHSSGYLPVFSASTAAAAAKAG
ncbi:SGNH/GDSL hydrolase family protein [Actinoallomurus purpureus]|uniref:SGNH/GDSL hydrolase family protein n=1 Tax=Actinoallomurus purpureus TaxID=478114 RepID=UPI0027E37B06|nr:SGNH/GDSL hydrolase family protein [Actinoallomurus purpureus]